MTEHTPGPWSIVEYGDDECPTLVIHKDTESRVCFMATPGSNGDPAVIEADARLIAAAPDLLEALGDLIADAEMQMKNPSYHMPFSMPKARAAIAKATEPRP